MDDVEEVRRLRDEYEGALDEAESKRAEYHRAIKKMHLAGVPLRDIAEQLGISHQRVHQIVTGESPQPKRKRAKTIGGVAVLILVVAASVGGAFAYTRRGPFTPIPRGPLASNVIQMPRVTGLSVVDAQRLLAQNDICVKQITASGTGEAADDVAAQSPAGGALITKGADVSIEVPGPERSFSLIGLRVPLLHTLTDSKAAPLSVTPPPASCGGELSVFRVSISFQGHATTLRESSGKLALTYSSTAREPQLTHFAA
jgi:hypothetical protein